MKCKNCGLGIIQVLERGAWTWVHYRADHVCGRPEPTPDAPVVPHD